MDKTHMGSNLWLSSDEPTIDVCICLSYGEDEDEKGANRLTVPGDNVRVSMSNLLPSIFAVTAYFQRFRPTERNGMERNETCINSAYMAFCMPHK